jgi:6-methylsalicylate decarboxylase
LSEAKEEAMKAVEAELSVPQSRGVPRREFLIGLAALGASALVPKALLAAQERASASAKPYRIDTHHHFSSPGFIAEIKARKTGQRPLEEWTAEKSVADMDKSGVATSIMSISEPSVWFGDDAAARRLARECNDYAARVMADHPGRFGLFGTLPLPDVDGSLREIEYCFDTIKSDGVCVMTSYQGKYLGDPAFAPVMDELNRRKAVVYCHPFRAACCQNLLPDGLGLGIELTTDTTRTVVSVLFSGTASRCPDIRFIWSHGGGTLPYLVNRLTGTAQRPDVAPRLPKGLIYELQKFYYDTAMFYNPYPLATLMKLVPTSHVVFGTDFPFASAETVHKGLGDYGFSASDLRAIERENALGLFPRLKNT